MAVPVPVFPNNNIHPESTSSIDNKSTSSSNGSTIGTSAANGFGDMLKRLTRTSTTKSGMTLASDKSSIGLTWTKKKTTMTIFLTAPYYVAGGQLHGMVSLEHQSVYLENWESLTLHLVGIEDAASLYAPVHESHKLWRALNNRCLKLDLTLSRSIWVSGSPIYLLVKAQNASKEKVTNMTLALLRREKYAFPEKDGYASVNSQCQVVAQCSLAETDWWQSLDPGMTDYRQTVLAVPSSQSHVSIRNQYLIQVSYSLSLTIHSQTNTELVTEIPLILVHPISVDPPPPGPYVIQREEIDPALAREVLFHSHRGKPPPGLVELQQEQRNHPPHPSSSSCSSCSSSSYHEGEQETCSSTRDQETTITGSTALISEKLTWKPLNKVKRKVSSWGLRLRQPASSSLNKEGGGGGGGSESAMPKSEQEEGPALLPAPTAAGPNRTSPRRLGRKASTSEKTESTLLADLRFLRPDHLREANSWSQLQKLMPITQSSQLRRRNTAKDVVRVGHVRAEKQYGKQHGSIGNAGLDIRHMFNVATAREAWQSCQAKVSWL
ncbi:hypothetical protein EC973_005365 [Apophysomyces ossiformis]|uniref:Arrestin C-terminal-like domain-containing protein n=1 Tax=Apophysomyces ossiformis TaxID=679940 RepID=A0A8H7BHG5_9FUNG|nr:hypothetical protein EC973_005365 [Apophysomyces ossiformis]